MNHALTTLYGGVTIPGSFTDVTPSAPPGAGAVVWILAVIAWLAFGVVIAGITRSGGHLAWAGIKPSHGGGNAATELMFGVVGLIITGTAGVIATTVAAFL